MTRKLIWLALGSVLTVGVVLTVRDYRIWHQAEVGKFGQGSTTEVGLADAKPLALPYSAFVGFFRLKPPVDWTVTENLALKNMDPYPILDNQSPMEIVHFKDPGSSAEVVVSAQSLTTDLSKLINAFAVGVTRDREYISVADINMTVLTWDKSDEVMQKVVFSKNDVFFVIESRTSVSDWKTWTKTFDAIYRSWTWI